MAFAGFFHISCVTLLFKAETTSGSLLTHSVDLLLLFVCFIFIRIHPHTDSQTVFQPGFC